MVYLAIFLGGFPLTSVLSYDECDSQDKVESFPFNVTANPMYYGSTMCFLSTALL